MSRRVYFYKDKNGAIKKFSYCCMCSAGPFKQSDKNIEFITTGGKSEMSYCIKCFKNLGMKSEDIIIPSSVNNEDIEIVEFNKKKSILEKPIEEILQEGIKNDIQGVIPQEEFVNDIPLISPEPVDENIVDPVPVYENIEELEPVDENIVDPVPVYENIEELEPVKEIIVDPVPVYENIEELEPVKESTLCEVANEIESITNSIGVKPEVEDNRKGEYFVYIGQFMDGSYCVDVVKDVIREVEDINAGNDPLVTKLPIELIYYNKMNSWKEALLEKDQILLMNNFQKEELSKCFIKKLFEDVHI